MFFAAAMWMFSVSDSMVTANELARMVRLYSAPWDEKCGALTQLHEAYGRKKTQLDIAIRQLQLIDAKVMNKLMLLDKRIYSISTIVVLILYIHYI